MADSFLKCISTNQALNFAGHIDHTSTPQKFKQPINLYNQNRKYEAYKSFFY